ncbi:MAG: hypothetical protein JKY50_10085 [Oleispira sp.]|nr:hypothetical protein [Oleispira sp.]
MLASTLSWSEISTLTASELTDTYIKDTTVIVRPTQAPKESVEKVRVNLKVSPIDEPTQIRPHDDERNLAAMSQELNSYTELNERAALSTNLQTSLPITSTQFLTPQPSNDVLNRIRAAYGLDSSAPVDLTSLPFLSNLTPTLGLENPGNATYSTSPDSFTIRIPNTGNFNTQNIASPNGEIGVNVTPSHIEYTLNLPR